MDAALQSWHIEHKARLGDVAGATLALDFGAFDAEVTAAREGLGILPLEACGVLLVRGVDAQVFLQGLTTNDVAKLQPGQVGGNLLCGTKGRILHPVQVLRLSADQFLVVTEPGEMAGVAGHLEAYHVREQVEIGRVPLLRVDLLGPAAQAALDRVGRPIAEPVGEFATEAATGPQINVALSPVALPRVMSLVSAAAAPQWVQALRDAAPDARLVGYEAFDEVRAAAGVPLWGVDYNGTMLAAEAALYDHISFEKGCYIGQEINARLHYRGGVNQKLMGVAFPEGRGTAPAVGAELLLNGEGVGVLKSRTRLAWHGALRGIALMRAKVVAEAPTVSTVAGGPSWVELSTLPTDLGGSRS